MSKYISADSLRHGQYDELLAQGWFRGTDQMYQADIICVGEGLFSAMHVRLNVRSWTERKSHRKILKKISPFRIEYREARCTERHQELYAIQSKRFQSFIMRDPTAIFHNPSYTGFKTMEVVLYHNEKLIAFSLFDVGFHAMASLLCCYDRDYLHLSLGKATMLLELQFAREHGIQHYYPGYVLDEPTRMDYKLFLGRFEYLTKECKWLEYAEKPDLGSSASFIKKILTMISELLDSFDIQHKTWIYPLHTLSLRQITADGQWISWPIYIELTNYPNIFIAADQYTGELVVFSGKLQSQLTIPNSVWPSSEFLDKDRFILHPMVAEKILERNLIRKNDNRLTIMARLLLIISNYRINHPSVNTHFAN